MRTWFQGGATTIKEVGVHTGVTSLLRGDIYKMYNIMMYEYKYEYEQCTMHGLSELAAAAVDGVMCVPWLNMYKECWYRASCASCTHWLAIKLIS